MKIEAITLVRLDRNTYVHDPTTNAPGLKAVLKEISCDVNNPPRNLRTPQRPKKPLKARNVHMLMFVL